MVKGSYGCTLFSMILILSIIHTPNSTAFDTITSDGEFIDFNDIDGTHFTDSIDTNGTMTFDGNNHSWSVVDLFDIDENSEPKLLLSGEYFNSITPIEDGLWEWNLNFNLTNINCTCELIVSSFSESVDGNMNQITSKLMVYLGDSNHQPFIMHDSVSSEKMDNENHTITFTVITPYINQVNPIQSINSGLMLYSSYCQAPSNVCLDNPIQTELNFTFDNNFLSVIVNQKELSLSDGYWSFDFSIKDQFLRDSNSVSSRIILDDTAPSVVLTSKSNILESESFLVYASIDDYFIGSPLSLTWTITDPQGSSRGLLNEESYHNSTIELTFDQSGDWDVQILVRDSANFIVVENLTISVENVVPIINLNLDGLYVSNGADLFILKDSHWLLNASSSIDTSNDIETLTYEWYHNGMILSKTGSTLSDQDVKIDSSSEIRLVISDDDMQSDEIIFHMSVSESTNDESSSKVLLYSGLGFLVLSSIVGLLLFSRRDSADIELPKWKSKN